MVNSFLSVACTLCGVFVCVGGPFHAVYSQCVVCASRGVFVAEWYIFIVKRCIFLFGKNEVLLYKVGQDK